MSKGRTHGHAVNYYSEIQIRLKILAVECNLTKMHKKRTTTSVQEKACVKYRMIHAVQLNCLQA